MQTQRTLENPVIGHQVRFLKTAEETGGELLQIEYIVVQKEPAPQIPLHIHMETTERFSVLQGELGVLIEGTRKHLLPGEATTIPTGAAHTFWNVGEAQLHFLTEVRPAGAFQSYWETVFGLAREGRINSQGLPSLFQHAVLADVVDTYDARIPPATARRLIRVLAPLGRVLGYRASYPRFHMPPAGNPDQADGAVREPDLTAGGPPGPAPGANQPASGAAGSR